MDEFRNKTVCVVGNAPNELGSANGKIIDSYDVVIRFNNFNISEEYSKDYGKRVTNWCCNFADDILFDNYIWLLNETVYCSYPLDALKWLSRYGSTNKRALEKLKYHTEFIPVRYFEKLCEHIDNPSLGLSLLFWMKKELPQLRKEDVFGFSFFDKSISHHYFNDHNRCYHNGIHEKRIFENVIFPKGDNAK